MARLIRKYPDGTQQVLELNLGVNRLGRSPECHFQIEDITVSTHHCDIILTAEAVLLRDHDSTNGSFVNGQPVREARLLAGQVVHLGDAELIVDNVDVTIAIPEYERDLPKPPVVLTDGSVLCKRHEQTRVTHRCTHCKEFMCAACVHVMRRKGGKPLRLCPLCSHPVEPLEAPKPKKRSLLAILKSTVPIPFGRKKKPPVKE